MRAVSVSKSISVSATLPTKLVQSDWWLVDEIKPVGETGHVHDVDKIGQVDDQSKT